MIDVKEREALTVHTKHHADQRPRASSGCERSIEGLTGCGDLAGLLLRSGHLDRQFPARDDNLDKLGAFDVILAAGIHCWSISILHFPSSQLSMQYA